MPTSLPDTLREAWGEEVATELVRFVEQIVREKGVHRDERPDREGGSTLGVYREVLSRLDVLEERFEQVEDRFDRVDERLDRVDERLNQMDERLDAMNARTDERFDAMNARMDERFDAMNARMDEHFERMTDQLDRMNDRILSMTRWIIGLIALFGTMVTVLLSIAQFGT
jgi:archaellum component FlaC